MPRIVVIGAGVSGLTSALLLSENKNNAVTVVAKHMPGDYDIEYTSPWAGANVLPMAKEADSRWERRTWPVLRRLAAEVPEAGIHFQKTHILRRPGADDEGSGLDPVFDKDPWYKDLMPDFRPLAASELRPGTASGYEFTSVCINTALYLRGFGG
ncbi:D-amino-acid oxidase, partial [Magnaporthiopsis poae ATCC 64411]